MATEATTRRNKEILESTSSSMSYIHGVPSTIVKALDFSNQT